MKVNWKNWLEDSDYGRIDCTPPSQENNLPKWVVMILLTSVLLITGLFCLL